MTNGILIHHFDRKTFWRRLHYAKSGGMMMMIGSFIGWFLSARNTNSAICLTVPWGPFNPVGTFLAKGSKQTKFSFHLFVTGL